MQKLQRGLSARHIRFIALGSAIGTGLFLGSGAAIQMAGPAVLLAYILGGAAVFIVMRALGEMTVHHPIAGSFGNYARHYLGPLAGFITGWTYAFEMIIVCVADVTAFGIYMEFWFPEIPRWRWILGIILFISALNLCHVKIFGEMEFWLSLLKVLAIIAMIIGGGTILILGMNSGETTATIANLWQLDGFAPHGIAGILASLTIVMFAFGGIEIIGITASEARDPAKMIPKAINTIPLRIILFYVLTLAIIMSLTPWQTIGYTQSPFVSIFETLGISSAANFLNIIVISAAISAINSDIFGAGRMIYGMAQERLAPKSFLRIASNGVPWMTVLVMGGALLVAVVLNYWIPKEIFLIIASIATFATIWVWLMILLSHFAMRKKIGVSKHQHLAFPVPFWPIAPILTTVFMLGIIVALGYFPATRVALLVGTLWVVLLITIYSVFVKKSQEKMVKNQAKHTHKKELLS